MINKPYHHGNLRNSLIENGILLINQEGVKHFSLRKVAALCGTSHAAPCSHFSNKEELLKAMQDHVTEQIMKGLKNTIQSYPNPNDSYLLILLGKFYVMFFIKNPQYFPFLFAQSGVEINLSMDDDGTNNFPPLELFKTTTFPVLRGMGIPEEKLKDTLISMWATVHGLASIATMKNVYYDEDWENKIEDIIWNK